jgi:hypothetical protein
VKVALLVAMLSGLLCYFLNPITYAVEVEPEYSYRVANGSIETTNGTVINTGEYIQIVRDHNSWAVALRRLDERFRPVGPELIASRRWTEAAVVPLSIDEVVAMAISLDEEVAQAGEPPCDCPPGGTIEAAVEQALLETMNNPLPVEATPTPSPQAVTRSLRPEPRPANLINRASAPPSSYLVKSSEDVDQYFACHAYSQEMHLDYARQYRSSIQRMSRAYARASGESLNQEEVSTLMSCLLFRESWGWRGINSDTGAVGLGQFTGTAIDQVKTALSYDVKSHSHYDRRDQIQRDEHQAGRLTVRELEANLEAIDNERRKNERFRELQELWNAIPISNRPSPSQINRSFMSENANHEAVIALSSLVVRECQIRYRQAELGMDSMTSLLACSGGYNMGSSGFMSEALDRRGQPQSLERWLANLRGSRHDQRLETHNHLVSIHRCMSEGENFPQCGTRPENCTALAMADQCQHNADPECWMEDRPRECPWPR